MRFQNQVLSLHSDALAEDTLMVARLSGREQLSGLFRFELDLICDDAELDLEAVLYAPAKLGVRVQVKIAGGQVGTATRELTGVFEEFEQLEEGQGWTKYRAVLVPKLWNTTRSFRSRIFQDMTIEELVKAVLEKDGLDPELDFEFQLQRAGDEDPESRPIYPKREYVVQYEESDWQFLSRWLEHEGIYFYFLNEGGEEKVVFADTEAAYAVSPFGTNYPYRPDSKGDGNDADKFTEEEISSFRCRQTRLPTHVTVNDYNWRIPSARLHFSEDVREDGTGLQAQYNDHFKNEAQGKALVQVRKEELACRARVFHGVSSCRAFRPGNSFTLEDHFRSDFNRSYLLVTVEHEAEQMISLESATITGVKYENRFTAIPDDRPFRPERVADWPSIKGVMHAKVDAEGDGKYAELDEHGRYKLKMPFDEHSDEADDGKASRWVRMAQPYAGANAGMHFPLLKGTEVLLTHIDGDPDRPVISGAVPNPETESPANASSPTRNAIQTASGTTMQIDDDENKKGFLFADATSSYISDRRRHKGAADLSQQDSPGGGGGGASPTGNGRADVPASGKGMTTEAGSKESGWNDPTQTGVQTAWNTFTTRGANQTNSEHALSDIRTNGRYAANPADHGEDRKTLSLSTIGGGSQGGVAGPGTGSPANPTNLNDGGLDAILAYLATVSTNLGQGDGWSSKEFPRSANEVEASAVLSRLHNFTGEAYGARLRAWVGDDWMIKVGDKFTYNDVTHDVSIGTGGYGWKEEHGDTDDHSWHWGDATSYSRHVGDEMSTSYREGTWNSHSYTYGAYGGWSMQFDAHGTLSLTGSIHTENSIDLGIYNANSLFIGAKGVIDIDIAAVAKLEMATAPIVEIEIAPARGKIGLHPKTWFELQTSEVKMQKAQVELNKTIGTLMSNESCVQASDNNLVKAQNVITETNNLLAQNNMALTARMNALSTGKMTLQEANQSLSANNQRLMNTYQAALTSM